MNRKCGTVIMQLEQRTCYEEIYCVVSLGNRMIYGIMTEEIGES